MHVDVHPQRQAVHVAVRGELDLATAGALQAQLDDLRQAGFQHVVLDLRELTFMDSTGVRLIAREDDLARSAGRRFSLIEGIPAVQRALVLCGLSERFDVRTPPAVPVRTPQHAPSRHSGLARPNLGIAFQRYLADLRQQGRSVSRLSPRRPGHTQAP